VKEWGSKNKSSLLEEAKGRDKKAGLRGKRGIRTVLEKGGSSDPEPEWQSEG